MAMYGEVTVNGVDYLVVRDEDNAEYYIQRLSDWGISQKTWATPAACILALNTETVEFDWETN